jgi:hypothetical protein
VFGQRELVSIVITAGIEGPVMDFVHLFSDAVSIIVLE